MSSSDPDPSRCAPLRGALQVLVVVAACLLCCALYLGFSAGQTRLGFPLDDAWIHQTYARNLAHRREWAFLPGEPSAGSTAPFWSALLSVGYGLGLDGRLWSYLLGCTALIAAGLVAAAWMRGRDASTGDGAWILGVLIVTEWHLVWSAVSGMEISLLILLVTCFFYLLEARQPHPLWIGVVAGLGVWVRPDAAILLLPALWYQGWRRADPASLRIVALMQVAIGFGLLVGPYMAFNQAITGSWWPNTFYAKQLEYSSLRERSIFLRFFQEAALPLIGVGAVLLPGVVLEIVERVKSGAWEKLAPMIWALAFLAVYAERLPVIYQHGRYAMPVIPVLLGLGWQGGYRWYRRWGESRLGWAVSRIWAGTLVGLLVAFAAIGARAYGQDVAIIETEMVQTARWVAANTEETALVAAHDIGALGYFGERRLLDLAGLVSPQVIPFIRDEAALGLYMDARRADVLVTFPGWYPNLIRGRKQLYTTGSTFSPRAGGENMAVYRWSD